jgi:acyl-ACP thioesterase
MVKNLIGKLEFLHVLFAMVRFQYLETNHLQWLVVVTRICICNIARVKKQSFLQNMAQVFL